MCADAPSIAGQSAILALGQATGAADYVVRALQAGELHRAYVTHLRDLLDNILAKAK